MYAVYEGAITPGSISGGPPSVPSQDIVVPNDQDIVSLDFFNMSPHRLRISVSGGQPDIYMAPNSSKEHVYIGRQSGATLTINQRRGHNVRIRILAVSFDAGLSSVSGDFSVMGFRKDEDWAEDSKRPIITGSITPITTSGLVVATSINNVHLQPNGTPVITTSGQSTNSGGINLNNNGTGTISLEPNGANPPIPFIVLTASPPTAQFGNPGSAVINDQVGTSTTFYGLFVCTINVETSTVTVLDIIDQVAGAHEWQLQKLSHTDANFPDGLAYEDATSGNFPVILDTGGTINTQTNLRLRTGHQENGQVGVVGKAVAAGDVWGIMVNFKEIMTNTPSSITLTPSVNTNVSSAVASGITTRGFTLKVTATAAGTFDWEGVYTTVGN